MTKLYAFLFGILASTAFSQAPAIDWQRTLGGNGYESNTKVFSAPDGGFWVCGTSGSGISGDKTLPSKGGSDVWVVKLDANGNTQWQKTYGGNSNDLFADLVAIPGGGFYMAVISGSDVSGDKTEPRRGTGGSDYWILKLDDAGTILWDKTIGGTMNDFVDEIVLAPDGGCFAGGMSDSPIGFEKSEAPRGSSDFWIVRLSENGNLLWDKTLGGSASEWFSTLTLTNSGSLIASGQSTSGISGDRTVASYMGYDTWVCWLDLSGNLLSQRRYATESISQIEQISDGNLVFCASKSFLTPLSRAPNSYQFFASVFKTDISGNLIWNYENQPTQAEWRATDIAESSDGSLYFSASGTDNGNSAGVGKLSATGQSIWNRTFIASGSSQTESLTLTQDGSLVAAMTSNANISGDKSEDSRGLLDYWIVKFDPEALSTNESAKARISVYPIPAKEVLYVENANGKAEIFNALGQKIAQQQVSETQNSIAFPFASGHYVLKITDAISGETQSVKIIK